MNLYREAKSLTISTLLVALALVFACGDASSNGSLSEVYCPGGGDAIRYEGQVYCRYAPDLLVEGFRCPDNAPFRFTVSIRNQTQDPGDLCSPEYDLVDSRVASLLRSFAAVETSEPEMRENLEPVELSLSSTTIDCGELGIGDLGACTFTITNDGANVVYATATTSNSALLVTQNFEIAPGDGFDPLVSVQPLARTLRRRGSRSR